MRKAFTLIECIVVICILAILVALVIPAIQQARESAKKYQVHYQLRNLQEIQSFEKEHPAARPFIKKALQDNIITDDELRDIMRDTLFLELKEKM